MASRLGRIGPAEVIGERRQRLRQQRLIQTKQRYDFRGPWQGFTPDVPHSRLDAHYTKDWNNLVVRPSPSGRGEVLTNDVGFIRVDPTNLPLGDHANTGNEICHLDEFDFTSTTGTQTGATSDTDLAITEGNGSTAGSQQLWRIHASSTAWEEIPHSAVVGSTAMTATIDGDANSVPSMVDSAQFPSGAPARADFGGAINTPAWVFTNNVDNVMVYPAGSGNLTDYEELTDQFGNAFKCVSVETYRDRMYFLNTSESGTRVRNRIRRSARGTCDPLATNPGAGSITIDELSDGLRLLALGNVLVAYFSDGVAFVRDTGNAAAPNAYQTLDVERGLLGTHSVCSVGGEGHFGIYDDGWWLLDANGRFTELGITQDDGGKQIALWQRRFYEIVAPTQGHRVYCTYDRTRHWVRIIVPTSETTRELWTFDIHSNRVFRGTYPNAPTCFGFMTIRDDAATTWGDFADPGDSWGSLDESWASFGAPAGNQYLVHGDSTGAVFYHDDNIFTQDGQFPSWNYGSIESNFGDPESLKRADKIALEHINSANLTSARVTVNDARGNSSGRNVPLSDGELGNVVVGEAWFTGPTSETLDFSVSGTGQIQIRGFVAETSERGTERT